MYDKFRMFELFVWGFEWLAGKAQRWTLFYMGIGKRQFTIKTYLKSFAHPRYYNWYLLTGLKKILWKTFSSFPIPTLFKQTKTWKKKLASLNAPPVDRLILFLLLWAHYSNNCIGNNSTICVSPNDFRLMITILMNSMMLTSLLSVCYKIT